MTLLRDAVQSFQIYHTTDGVEADQHHVRQDLNNWYGLDHMHVTPKLHNLARVHQFGLPVVVQGLHTFTTCDVLGLSLLIITWQSSL